MLENSKTIWYWSGRADDFRTFLLNYESFELAFSEV